MNGSHSWDVGDGCKLSRATAARGDSFEAKSTQESLNAFEDFTAFPTVGSNAKIESKNQEPLLGTEATCTRYRWHIASKYASSVKPLNDASSGSLKTFIVAQTLNGFICHFKRASLCSKAATASGCAGPAQPPKRRMCGTCTRLSTMTKQE